VCTEYIHMKCTNMYKRLTSMAAVMAWWSGVTGSGGSRLGGGGLESPRPTLNEMPPDAIDASWSKSKCKERSLVWESYKYNGIIFVDASLYKTSTKIIM